MRCAPSWSRISGIGNEGLLQHLQSDEYLRVLLTIEMSEAPPEIRFDEISETRGLKTIKKE
jgi:hypothetical protein